ncbi:hypothetical protein B9Z19DRAFT_1063442 [Tuber borchii]|uniref:Uncharacterized protein n=1 Tax=Tuber borchii TaxID=42251 RepID=A0A2T6ZYG4_TUBBO|nr:hypothetical protein B9Z19DRAFT_1063442 [Tuber borchii]
MSDYLKLARTGDLDGLASKISNAALEALKSAGTRAVFKAGWTLAMEFTKMKQWLLTAVENGVKYINSIVDKLKAVKDTFRDVKGFVKELVEGVVQAWRSKT